jgi:ligand-binding SRPBCC domain-containing protein
VFVYTRAITMQAPIQAVYDFHLNPHFIRHILPSYQKIIGLEEPDRVEIGAPMKLDMRVYGWKQKWVVAWEDLQAPQGTPAQARMVEVARRSPFRAWRHIHLLAARSGGTEMIDRVEYDLPWGALGRMMQPLVHGELDAMFRVRQRRTKLVMEEMMNPTHLTTGQPGLKEG